MKLNYNKTVSTGTKSLKKSHVFEHNKQFSPKQLVGTIIKGVTKPLMAARASLLRNPNIQPFIQQIPWIPVVLIVVGGTVLLYKDLSFNLNLSAPTGGQASGAVAHAVREADNGMFSSTQERKNQAYIESFAPIAIAEMKTYGVPASVLLAQALIESQAGESEAATAHNNHFSIKCYSSQCRKGHCANLEKMGHKAFYRKYTAVEDSWRAQSLILTTGKYRHLKSLSNYKEWANALQQAGFHSASDYAKRLIELIEYYELQRLDQA